jgi:hypothetical protein
VAGLAGSSSRDIDGALGGSTGKKEKKEGLGSYQQDERTRTARQGFLWQLTAAFINGSAAACSAGRRCSGDPRRTEHVGERRKAWLAAVASRCACMRRRDKTGSSEVTG